MRESVTNYNSLKLAGIPARRCDISPVLGGFQYWRSAPHTAIPAAITEE
jgi:hypothetical protein